MLIRRTIVFALCVLVVYVAWIMLRGQPIPGSDRPLSSLPIAAKGSLLFWATLGLYGLMRLGGRVICNVRAVYRNDACARSSVTPLGEAHASHGDPMEDDAAFAIVVFDGRGRV
jgi:hypothetical protein